MDEKYIHSKAIEMIIKEKTRKQELIMDLESVDDKDLLDLLDELNKESSEKQ